MHALHRCTVASQSRTQTRNRPTQVRHTQRSFLTVTLWNAFFQVFGKPPASLPSCSRAHGGSFSRNHDWDRPKSIILGMTPSIHLALTARLSAITSSVTHLWRYLQFMPFNMALCASLLRGSIERPSMTSVTRLTHLALRTWRDGMARQTTQ